MTNLEIKIKELNAKKMITYIVTIEGNFIKDTETVFTSLKKAKEFMKTEYDFCIKWEAYLLTLVKREYDNKGDYDATQINTRTTIINF